MNHFDVNTARRQLRIIALLQGAEVAGISPVPILQLHTFAYLSNVLAPVWNLNALDGALLKRRGGPFYPELQHDLDRLVGRGIVIVSRLAHVVDDENHWRLEGAFQLNHEFSNRIVAEVIKYEDERKTLAFIQELFFAVSMLTDDELNSAVGEDATYMDPSVDIGSVIDFGEWQHLNFSANAAEYFGHFAVGGAFTTPGEKLHLYMSHIRGRLVDASA